MRVIVDANRLHDLEDVAKLWLAMFGECGAGCCCHICLTTRLARRGLPEVPPATSGFPPHVVSSQRGAGSASAPPSTQPRGAQGLSARASLGSRLRRLIGVG